MFDSYNYNHVGTYFLSQIKFQTSIKQLFIQALSISTEEILSFFPLFYLR